MKCDLGGETDRNKEENYFKPVFSRSRVTGCVVWVCDPPYRLTRFFYDIISCHSVMKCGLSFISNSYKINEFTFQDIWNTYVHTIKLYFESECTVFYVEINLSNFICCVINLITIFFMGYFKILSNTSFLTSFYSPIPCLFSKFFW